MTMNRQVNAIAGRHGRKPWAYALIPYDAIAENITLQGLAERYS